MSRLRTSLAAFAVLTAPAAADRTADQLRQAVSLARSGQAAKAVEALPAASAATAEHLPALREAARALLPEQPADALRPLAAILRLKPDDVFARRMAEDIWMAQPAPRRLSAEALPAIPANVDAWASAGGAVRVVVLSPKPFVAPAPMTRRGSPLPFPNLHAVYLQKDGALSLAATVRGQEAVDATTSNRVARMCGALAAIARPLDAARGRTDGPVRVWLETAGAPGAETAARDIAIPGANGARTPLEWMRQLSHEWGHACIPGVGGFQEPEPWANGDLGERLFLPMLARQGLDGVWGEPVDIAAYASRYVTPLTEAFARKGPVKGLVEDRTRLGYDHFLGAALYVSETYGADVLTEALGSLPDRTMQGFLAAVSEVLRDRKSVVARRPGGARGPRPICIPLRGTHMLRGAGVSIAGKAVRGPVSLPAGWILVEWTGALTVTPQTGGRRESLGRPVQIRPAGANGQQ